MTTIIPISELKQRTGKILGKAVIEGQDIIIERYGQEYAVILSRQRYQELVDNAQARVRERFLKAQQAVYAATAGISEDEIDEIVATAVTNSRRNRAGLDASDT